MVHIGNNSISHVLSLGLQHRYILHGIHQMHIVIGSAMHYQQVTVKRGGAVDWRN